MNEQQQVDALVVRLREKRAMHPKERIEAWLSNVIEEWPELPTPLQEDLYRAAKVIQAEARAVESNRVAARAAIEKAQAERAARGVRTKQINALIVILHEAIQEHAPDWCAPVQCWNRIHELIVSDAPRLVDEVMVTGGPSFPSDMGINLWVREAVNDQGHTLINLAMPIVIFVGKCSTIQWLETPSTPEMIDTLLLMAAMMEAAGDSAPANRLLARCEYLDRRRHGCI